MSLRWRKQPNETGLRRVVQGPRGAELRDGKRVVMRVAPLGRGADGEWYWYGLGANTAAQPLASIEEAKRGAEAYAREHYKPTPPPERPHA